MEDLPPPPTPSLQKQITVTDTSEPTTTIVSENQSAEEGPAAGVDETLSLPAMPVKIGRVPTDNAGVPANENPPAGGELDDMPGPPPVLLVRQKTYDNPHGSGEEEP